MGKQVVQKLIRVKHFHHVDLNDFWGFIAQQWIDREQLIMGKKRSLYVSVPTSGVYKGYVLGLLVSYKDEKTQTSLTSNAAGKKVFTVSDIKGGMDYNFFIMSRANGVAIFQYYHGSASDSVLQEMIRTVYEEFKTSRLEAELKNIPADTPKTKASKLQAALRKKWHKWPKVSLVVKKDEFIRVLSKWKEIQKFTYQVSEFNVAGSAWVPFQNIVKADSHTLKFEPDSPVQVVAKAIGGVRHLLSRGRVSGIDEVQAKRTVDLIEISENIAVYDFDELSKKIDGLELDSFSKSHVFKWIMDSIEERKADFTTPIQDDDED